MSLLERIVSIFVALVFLFFVLSYPHKIVEFLDLFVQAAKNVADAIGQGVGNASGKQGA